jgi:hypothetical protein
VGIQEVSDPVSVVVGVHDDPGGSRVHQPVHDPAQEGTAPDLNQGLGHLVGEWAEAGSGTGRQDHGLHQISLWLTLRSTWGNLDWMWAASFPAMNTDRCRPPVHPKEIVRLLNARER